MSLVEAFLPAAVAKTENWINQMRDRHRPVARSLRQNEREILENYFEAELLDAIRLKEVSQIEKPPFYEGLRSQLSFVGMRITFDFTNATGITFDNCVLLNQSPLTMDLLFHELVHAEQYRRLGVSRFAAAYVRGFAECGFVHQDIPLEMIAIALTDRYLASEKFGVSEQIATWLSTKDY